MIGEGTLETTSGKTYKVAEWLRHRTNNLKIPCLSPSQLAEFGFHQGVQVPHILGFSKVLFQGVVSW